MGLFVATVLWLLCIKWNSVTAAQIDSNGYVVYCPCMGRFGNQADHFLGALGFAHGLNRTLVLPPWVEYIPGKANSSQISFDTYFKVEPLQKYHRVILMGEFMREIAPKIWPKNERTAFCYLARHNSDGCNAKEGNPFGPFWDHFGINFIGSEFYRPLTYDVYHQSMDIKWNEKYPPADWPVLPFTGAPASFPVQLENRELQQYVEWDEKIVSEAKSFISTLPRGPFIAIHLRNGIDWVRACEHVLLTPALFSAPQCLGYRGEHGPASKDLCLPTKEIILKQLRRVIKTVSAKSVFVASDNDHMITFLNENLHKMQVTVHRMPKANPHIELAIMGLSNHFIGNCVSSFSAFAVRDRRSKGLPCSFWAFPVKKRPTHTEL